MKVLGTWAVKAAHSGLGTVPVCPAIPLHVGVTDPSSHLLMMMMKRAGQGRAGE